MGLKGRVKGRDRGGRREQNVHSFADDNHRSPESKPFFVGLTFDEDK